jgi:hypothetical protein
MSRRRWSPIPLIGVAILIALALALLASWGVTGQHPDPFGACQQPGAVCNR